MNKIFKLYIILAVIGTHLSSLGMLSALRAMPDSYKKKIEKTHSIPLAERKLGTGAKLERLKIVVEDRKCMMPTLARETLLQIASYDVLVARNMRAACKDMNNALLQDDSQIHEARSDIMIAESFLKNDVCYDSVRLNNALKYVLISDDVRYLKRLFDMREKEINELKSQRYANSNRYWFYARTIEKALCRPSHQCVKWMITANPLKVNNHVVHDIVDCYLDEVELSMLNGIMQRGPLLDDLWNLCPRDKDGIVNFGEYLRFEELCKENGCKSRKQIVEEYEERKTASVTQVLRLSELVAMIGEHASQKIFTMLLTDDQSIIVEDKLDKSSLYAMRLTCKDMHKAISIPELEEAQSYLSGEWLKISSMRDSCIRALKLEIIRHDNDDGKVLCELIHKNMDCLTNKRDKYELYRGLIAYAIRKKCYQSFGSLIKANPDLNNYYEAPVLHFHSIKYHHLGPIMDEIESMKDTLGIERVFLLVFCKENGCLTLGQARKIQYDENIACHGSQAR